VKEYSFSLDELMRENKNAIFLELAQLILKNKV
jgi:hypothetical protein